MKKTLSSVRKLAAQPVAQSAKASEILARSRDVSTAQLAAVAGGWRLLGSAAA
jgi:hypothetical protein